MRLILPLILFCSTLVSSAQDSLLYKFDGYIGKTRLRDIDAKYGEAAFTTKATIIAGTLIRQFVFDYGQYYKKDKDVTISNSDGTVINFGSIAMILNFFDYNGWEFISKMDQGNSYIFLFKKKQQ